ncbi:MAG TPA: hypothetical protein VMC80_00365 [Patescibacteria group bacterium]|nr:hypothetical protein [Patescibacteria group bacterium]
MREINFSKKNKKAAIEMSIGTIVTIVLAISFLVLGIFLIQRIGKSATSVVDLTDQQLRDQLNNLFSTENKVVVIPQTDTIPIKQEATGGVVVGIKNLQQGTAASTTFSYAVSADDVSNCGITAAQAEAWMATGKTGSNIQLASGDFDPERVIFRIPTGAPLCIAKFRVNVNVGGQPYGSAAFNIEVQAK